MLLSDVCLSVAYIGPKSRTERPRKTKISTKVAHVTRDSDTTFKVKRSKVKVTRPLWLVVLAGQHGHTVMVTYYPYAHMTYIVTPRAGLGGGISWRPPAYSLFLLLLLLPRFVHINITEYTSRLTSRPVVVNSETSLAIMSCFIFRVVFFCSRLREHLLPVSRSCSNVRKRRNSGRHINNSDARLQQLQVGIIL